MVTDVKANGFGQEITEVDREVKTYLNSEILREL